MKIMRLAPLENARRSRSRPRPALAALFWIGLLAASPAATNYVAQGGQTPASPYTSWVTAASNIQDAINQAIAGDTVLVSNGVYETGGVTNFPSGTVLTNRVAIYKAITVQAFSTNPADTLIKGAGPNGPAAVRCVWMTNGSTLIGFTLTNGATLTSGANVERGGGVSCQSTDTVISNCVLTGNSAGIYGGGAMYGTLFNCTLAGNSAGSAGYGGGVYGSTLTNCTLTSNSAYYGGGASYGTLTDCTLRYNSATYGAGTYYATLSDCTIVSNTTTATGQGGGAYNGTLTDCTLIGNVAQWGGGAVSATLTNCTLSGNAASFANGGGGGANGGTLYNCILTNNSSSSGNGGGGAYGGTFYNCTLVNNVNPYYGGGVIYGALYNCKLIGNRTYYGAFNSGGGAYGSTLYNCTVSGNSSRYDDGLAGIGGGVYGGNLINCIVYGNSAYTAGASNWYAVVTFTNTCTAPAATNGVGNITSDPLFVDTNAANYRLSVYSPPLNAGTNLSWMTVPTDVRSKDLDGLRRIDQFSRQVDMGCYELMPRGTLFIGH